MRIDRLGLNLRARSAWEAIDLGVALARHHAPAWLFPWALCAGLLVALLMAAGHALGWMAAVPFALWWLKPALDRIPLYVLSRAVFGHVPPRREIYRAAWSWGWGATLPRLLWLRFDPFRALSMPSDLLEGLPRAERGQRRSLLRREVGAQTATLWVLLPVFETVLVLGAWALLALFIPLEWWEARGGGWFEAMADGEVPWLDALNAALLCLAILVIEPIFVAAGFGLYLSRRVHLEAWDLELGFKRMAARAQSQGRGVSVFGSVAIALLWVGLAGALPVDAKPPASDAPHKLAPRSGASTLPAGFAADEGSEARLAEALRAARDDASLGGTETVTRWKAKDDWVKELPEDNQERLFNWKEALGRWVGAIVGVAAEILLWLVVIAVLAFVVYRYRDWLPWRRERAGDDRGPPPLRHRGLTPEDVAAAPELLQRARAAWARGDQREAFACLYRAGLKEVSVRRPRPLPPGTTEGQLLRAARALSNAAAGQHVTRLVRTWQAVAYAGHRADAAAFDALIAAWPEAFAEAAP